ncbi:MAG: hypothetical protein A4S09_13880 [Proteobacteria bacterium SG_bin7]|nr:MAG: hypothetical protein A4S09_13880 [Proteobacteria bacterium SG_bin7]
MRLSALWNLYRISSEPTDIIFPGLDDIETWKNWMGLVTHNGIEGQIYLQIKKFNLENSVPKEFLESLKRGYWKNKFANEERLKVALPVLADCVENGVEIIVLKGNAIALPIYGDIGYKQMNDIDILIKKSDLDKVALIYEKHGLKCAAALGSSWRRQEKFSHHWPAFFSKDLKCFFGTHWNIVPPLADAKVSAEDLWKSKEAFNFFGLNLYRLGTDQFLNHLCLHLSPYKLGLREIGDLFNFIFYHEYSLNSKSFLALVKASGSHDRVFRAASIVNSLFVNEFCRDILAQTEPFVSLRVKKEVSNRIAPPEKILFMRTTQVAKIEKSFAMFSLCQRPHEKAYFLSKMWKNFLFAPLTDAWRLSHQLPEESLCKQIHVRLKAPIQISRELIQSLGLKIFILVTVRHHIELLKSIVNAMLLRKQLSISEVAAEYGLSLEVFRKVAVLD